MNTLYLLPEEKKLFDALSEELKGSVDMSEAALDYNETPEKRVARLRLLHFENSGLKDLQAKAVTAKSEEELQEIAGSLDFDAFSQHDLTEVFYAMGPEVMGNMITSQLPTATTAKDVDGIAAISTFRYLLFCTQ